MDDLMKKVLEENPHLARMLAGMASRQPSLRFWRNRSGDRYFYTTEKVNHKGNQRYVAGIYRTYKTKRTMELVRSVGFAKKYKAKEWAYAQFVKEKGMRRAGGV